MASPATVSSPSPAVAPAPMTLSPDQMEALCYDRFMQYSGFGDKTKAGEIDGALFAKLCKVSDWGGPARSAEEGA